MGKFIVPQNLDITGLNAFFSTKELTVGGLSDMKSALSEELGIQSSRIYLPVQKHTSVVHVLGDDHTLAEADAVITDRRNVLVGVVVADCVPVLLYDREKGIVGAVHAGWRGTAEAILSRTVEAMLTEFGSQPEHIYMAIGPSIRKCSYEVGEEVVSAVKKATGEGQYHEKSENAFFLDLSSANRIQARNSGIPEDNVWLSDECTFCNPEKYHSYRYAHGCKGRQGGFIGMW